MLAIELGRRYCLKPTPLLLFPSEVRVWQRVLCCIWGCLFSSHFLRLVHHSLSIFSSVLEQATLSRCITEKKSMGSLFFRIRLGLRTQRPTSQSLRFSVPPFLRSSAPSSVADCIIFILYASSYTRPAPAPYIDLLPILREPPG